MEGTSSKLAPINVDSEFEVQLRVKVKSRESTEVIVGAVTGSMARPETVVAGAVRDGVLQIVGKTTPLNRTQARELATALTPAGPEHLWPDEVASTRFGSAREKIRLVKVEPVLVAEVLADAALQAGGYRHPLRYVRLRRDLFPRDLTPGSHLRRGGVGGPSA